MLMHTEPIKGTNEVTKGAMVFSRPY